MDRMNRASFFVPRVSFRSTNHEPRTANREPRTTNHAFTLMELLVAIAISALLGAATVLMLGSSLDAYIFSEEQALIHKILDETLAELSGEGFKNYGIKDSLEILEAKEDSLIFLPLWIDDSHRITSRRQKLVLNRPFSLGAAIPTLELKTKGEDFFLPAPITFTPHRQATEGESKDTIIPQEPLVTGSQARIVFQPDPQRFSDVIMRLIWDAQAGRFLRTYNHRTEAIPKEEFKGFKLTQARFQYFDHTNTEIPAPVPEELLPAVSAVKINLSLESGAQVNKRQASAFINLRNSRTSGKGLVLRKGMRMRIPDSRRIRTFSLGNIVGVKEGDIIQLNAQPRQGKSWRLTIELGITDGLPNIKRYAIDYPAGSTLYSEEIRLTCDLPFDLLAIGKNGRYDYDFDEDAENVVDLKGEVNLVVEEMTPQGAALFVRP